MMINLNRQRHEDSDIVEPLNSFFLILVYYCYFSITRVPPLFTIDSRPAPLISLTFYQPQTQLTDDNQGYKLLRPLGFLCLKSSLVFYKFFQLWLSFVK